MKAELLEVMGSDLTIVNAARVSFAAESHEFSRRYVDLRPQFHEPEGWRLKANNKKQGSSLETFTGPQGERWDVRYWDLMNSAETLYQNMVASEWHQSKHVWFYLNR